LPKTQQQQQSPHRQQPLSLSLSLANSPTKSDERSDARYVYSPAHIIPSASHVIHLCLSQRHEERKEQHKALASDRRWRHEQQYQRQEQRQDDGTRAYAGRTLDFHRNIATPSTTDADDDDDGAQDYYHEQREEKGKWKAREEEEELVVPQDVASGAMLLAMARPAKTRHGRRGRPHRSPLAAMTDGEAFEVIEVDGRLVALDEDGWEILPDENAEKAFVLYSEIVRGIVR